MQFLTKFGGHRGYRSIFSHTPKMKMWFYALKMKICFVNSKKKYLFDWAEILPRDKAQNLPSFGTGRKSLAWKNFWNFFSNFLVKSVRKNENFWEKIWLFELDTSKKREKFTDHDGVVRFLKSQKIKKLYIYFRIIW